MSKSRKFSDVNTCLNQSEESNVDLELNILLLNLFYEPTQMSKPGLIWVFHI